MTLYRMGRTRAVQKREEQPILQSHRHRQRLRRDVDYNLSRNKTPSSGSRTGEVWVISNEMMFSKSSIQPRDSLRFLDVFYAVILYNYIFSRNVNHYYMLYLGVDLSIANVKDNDREETFFAWRYVFPNPPLSYSSIIRCQLCGSKNFVYETSPLPLWPKFGLTTSDLH